MSKKVQRRSIDSSSTANLLHQVPVELVARRLPELSLPYWPHEASAGSRTPTWRVQDQSMVSEQTCQCEEDESNEEWTCVEVDGRWIVRPFDETYQWVESPIQSNWFPIIAGKLHCTLRWNSTCDVFRDDFYQPMLHWWLKSRLNVIIVAVEYGLIEIIT